MKQKNSNKDGYSFNKRLWPIYFLNGFQSIAFGSFMILVVPLSLLFWPNEPYHALEMGILITTLFWSGSISGLILGRIIDKYSRRLTIFLLSLFRGGAVIMLGFATPRQGITSWAYFFIWMLIFGFAAGGFWPSVISLTNDAVPNQVRSRFFGIYEVVRNLSTVSGFLFATYLVEKGFWRELFWTVGLLIITMGTIFYCYVKEPKRGAQREELSYLLEKEGIVYEYQVDKKMIKETMLSKTNLVALIEGISTMILMGSINILILPFVQSDPINISPFATAVFMVVFGLSGGLVGTILLARLCDKIAEEHPIRRLPIIVFAISGGLFTFALFFFLPWPHLSINQGRDVSYLMALPSIWLMGSLFFMSRSIFSLYIVNQAPVLQEINLPEAQGQIVSWNQFLENIGRGIGPILTGVLLFWTANNYPLVAVFLVFFILPGTVLWLFALRWFPNDRKTIQKILSKRAQELERKDKHLSTT